MLDNILNHNLFLYIISATGDRTDGQGVRSAGTSDAESRQGIQQGEFVETAMG